MRERESEVENYLVKKVEEVGGVIRKIKWIGRRSCPDRFIAFDTGWNGLTEVKRPGEKPRPDQEREIETLRSIGVKVVVLSTKGEVDDFIARHGVKW